MILGAENSITQMPRKNKKCPCKSMKNYKNCCLEKDNAAKCEYILKLEKIL